MAADLARARARAARVKRPYQPSLAAYFPFASYSHPSSSSSSAREHSAHHSELVPLQGCVQASLLSVGMRVRKAVSGGYQTHDKAAGGLGLKIGLGKENTTYADGLYNIGLGKENNYTDGFGEGLELMSGDARGKKRAFEDDGAREIEGPLNENETETEHARESENGNFNQDQKTRPPRISMQERKIVRPTMRLRRRQKLPPPPVQTVNAPMDIDFDEADFLRPRSEAVAPRDAVEDAVVAMDVG